MYAGAINKMGFNGKKLKAWYQEKQEEAKIKKLYKKTASALIRKRAIAAGYRAEEKEAKAYARKKAKLKYKRKYKAISSPSKGSTNRFSQASDAILGGFSGGGIYSPYNLAREKKRAAPKKRRKTTKRKRKAYYVKRYR